MDSQVKKSVYILDSFPFFTAETGRKSPDGHFWVFVSESVNTVSPSELLWCVPFNPEVATLTAQ